MSVNQIIGAESDDDGQLPLGGDAAGAGAEELQTTPPLERNGKKGTRCRYFGKGNGCRAGDSCPFLHDPSRIQGSNAVTRPLKKAQNDDKTPHEDGLIQKAISGSPNTLSAGPSGFGQRKPRYGTETGDRSKVVQKPVSQIQVNDPREFQIQQLRRRFSPKEVHEENDSAFIFTMVPSDPDFPFEMAGLDCVLHVPATYPRGSLPFLNVRNKEMDRGYQINVERGFDALLEEYPRATLLALMNALDKRLESLLTEQKAETVKLILNASTGSTKEGAPKADHFSQSGPRTSPMKAAEVRMPPQAHKTEEKRTAEARREMETRQLEARLGRLPLYNKSTDGIVYTLPIEPRKRADLPVSLHATKSLRLFVPLSYPLNPCRIEIQGASKEAITTTEKGFERRAKESPEMTLMGLINYLSQNMHILATEFTEDTKIDEDNLSLATLHVAEQHDKSLSVDQSLIQEEVDDRNHLKIIPRPPEWSSGGKDNADRDSNSSDSYDSEDEFDDEASEGELNTNPEGSTTVVERGILLSFPFLELHGIELLEIVSLCVTIKCERCKDTMDISNLRNASNTETPGLRTESCKKCATPLSIGFRRELMHVNSVRAGYLDLNGCTVVDMLPSNFIPTCSECSTSFPKPGLVSVRGESSMAVCRDCHHKLSFKIPEVKFLVVSSAALRASQGPSRKKPRENLGIIAGQELPRRGRCTHYSKSYRWFRFSCCAKVFPCDKCHDAASDHPNEHANRMICGNCSREQPYRPETCSLCHVSLIAKSGTGFWEGGKGTRDKVRMNRKDPRKYKRRPGGKPRTT